VLKFCSFQLQLFVDKSREISTTFDLKEEEGHLRWSILVSTESPCTTSY